jgi:sulfatase-like protein
MRKNMASRTDSAAESESRAGSGSGIWGAAASGDASQRLGAVIRLMWGAFLLLTSLYCLLAFLPYTYYAVIKALPYAWMAWFVRHHALLFWLTGAAAAAVYRRGRNRTLYLAGFGFLACAGVFLLFRPFLADIGNDWTAFWAGIAALWAIVLVVSLCDLPGLASAARETRGPGHLSYVTAAWLAAAVVLVSVAGTRMDAYVETRSLRLHRADLFILLWNLLVHLCVAVVVVSILNIVRTVAARTSRPSLVRWSLYGLLVWGFLWVLAARFLDTALSFAGWPAQFYSASLAAALTLLGFSAARPFLDARPTGSPKPTGRGKSIPIAVSSALILAALAFPTAIAGGDWNGFCEGTFTLLWWTGLGLCAFQLWPGRKAYTLYGIIGVLLVSLFSYKALEASEIIWAQPLGHTDDQIQTSLDSYAAHDASFALAHDLLGGGITEDCGDLCHILREYTEIRPASVPFDVSLVDSLTPATGERPNIFIFVIDSMRPDYLGAYNPKANFTPNMDALARDSVVIHNAFTTYAGTSLSEPAIWSGMLILHAHYMQPFQRVNSLEKLARTDGYQMVLSYDEILKQILSPSDDLVKLDTNVKVWNQLEVCSTIQQTESAIDRRTDTSRPIFFYSQPKNVHQFGKNNLPPLQGSHWPQHPGFNYRISYEMNQVDSCMGGFVAWLKGRGLYDHSIIVLTSDHGDATGESGRYGHSTVIYPEVMRVPLIVHLPKSMQNRFVHDDRSLSALIDITPSLYYLLGHRPIVANPLFGHPLLVENLDELRRYRRDDLFLASDVRAAYGILTGDGRYFYATYDSPAESYLYDLQQDPNGVHDILTDRLKKSYDEQIIRHLQAVGSFYEYKPGVGQLLARVRYMK